MTSTAPRSSRRGHVDPRRPHRQVRRRHQPLSHHRDFRGNWRGVYIFNNLKSFLNVLNNVPGAVPDQFRIFYGDGAVRRRGQQIPAFFVQDSWRINRRVTLSGGLRYAAYAHADAAAAESRRCPTRPRFRSDTKEFQPRMGLAVDLTGDGKTVFRAATGLFYADTPGLLLNQAYNSSGQRERRRDLHPECGSDRRGAAGPSRVRLSLRAQYRQRGRFRLLLRSGVSRAEARRLVSSLPDFRNPRSFNYTFGLERADSTRAMSVASTGCSPIRSTWSESATTNLLPASRAATTTRCRPAAADLQHLGPSEPELSAGCSRSRARRASNYDGLTLAFNQRLSPAPAVPVERDALLESRRR